MQSCDTLSVAKKYSANCKNLIGKNSDRPVTEAQPLVYISGATHKKGELVKCTHMTLVEAERTYSVIGSKPYWIWGFEMGVNEFGLFIGNEAQGSRNAEVGVEGLLGMDMLRLALERSKNCREAISLITSLLEKYGQSANASMLFERRYENAFMLMDNDEIWVLETAGREWVAKKIDSYRAISNCYSIGEDFDISSENLIKTAEEKGWYINDEQFNFARAYTLPAVRQTFANARYQRMNNLLSRSDKHDFDSVKRILRDHFEGTDQDPRFDAEAGTFYSVCMHPQTWDSSKTAASMLMTYDDDFGFVMQHAFSLPCTSVYMPVYFTGYLPSIMQYANEKYEEKSLWWAVERLTLGVSANPTDFKKEIKAELASLEDKIASLTAEVEAKARELIRKGDKEACNKLLNEHMDFCAQSIYNKANELFHRCSANVQKRGGITGSCIELLDWYCNRCDIQI